MDEIQRSQKWLIFLRNAHAIKNSTIQITPKILFAYIAKTAELENDKVEVILKTFYYFLRITYFSLDLLSKQIERMLIKRSKELYLSQHIEVGLLDIFSF